MVENDATEKDFAFIKVEIESVLNPESEKDVTENATM